MMKKSWLVLTLLVFMAIGFLAVGNAGTVRADAADPDHDAKRHCICGGYYSDADSCPYGATTHGEGVQWTAWTSGLTLPSVSGGTADNPAVGYFYLTKDINTQAHFYPNSYSTVYICLNGYKISRGNGANTNISRLFYCNNDKNQVQYIFTDCSEEDSVGKITSRSYTRSADHAYIFWLQSTTKAEVTCYRISIDLAPVKSASHAPIYITSNASMSLYGVNITGCDVSGQGGVFRLQGNGKLTVKDSVITGGSASLGGVLHMTGGTADFTNVTVDGATATQDGGAIVTTNSSGNALKLTLNQVEITNTSAASGILYINNNSNGTVTVNDSVIVGNTATNGSSIYVASGNAGKLNLSGESVLDEVYLESGKKINQLSLQKGAKIQLKLADGTGEFVTTAPTGDSILNFVEAKDQDKYVVKNAEGKYAVENAAAFSAQNHVAHCFCSGYNTTGTHTHTTEGIDWIPWTETNSLPFGVANETRYYYLTESVSVSSVIWQTYGSTVYLCLNGKNITHTANGRLIGMSTGNSSGTKATYVITNCGEMSDEGEGKGLVSHSNTSVYSSQAGFFYLGGSSNNSTSYTLELYHVIVDSKNFTSSANGTISQIEYNSTLNTYDVKLIGSANTTNKAANGGLIRTVGANAQANFYHSVLTDGKASQNGGNLYINGGRVTLSDTVVTNGNATGRGDDIYLASGGSLTIEGKTVIGELYLTANKTVTIGENGLTSGSDIAVILASGTGAITGSNAVDYSAYFQAPEAETGFGVAYVDSVVTIAHYHKLFDGTGYTETVWTEWTDTDKLPTVAGNYYLTGNVALSAQWSVPADVNLCLHGNTVTGSSSVSTHRAILINGVHTVGVCDCLNSGKIQAGTGETKNAIGGTVCVNRGATFNLYSGEIVGGTIQNNDGRSGGAAVGVDKTAVFNMYGGTLNGGTVTGTEGYGGVVFVRSTEGEGEGTFNLYGGTIHAGSAPTGGKAVGVFGGNFTMTGGTIETTGEAVYIGPKAGTVSLQGGTVAGDLSVAGGYISALTTAIDGDIEAKGGYFTFNPATLGMTLSTGAVIQAVSKTVDQVTYTYQVVFGLASWSMTVEADLSIHFNVYQALLDAFPGSSLKFEIALNGDTETAEAEEFNEFYRFTYRGVTADLMTAPITVTLSSVAEGGDETVIQTKTITVKEYLNSVIAYQGLESEEGVKAENLTEEKEALYALIRDLFIYGREAQKYFNTNTEDPVVEESYLDSKGNLISAESVSDPNYGADTNTVENKIFVSSVTVLHRNANRIRFTVVIPDGANIKDCITVTAGGSEVEYETSLKSDIPDSYKQYGTFYTVTTEPIAPTAYGTEIVLTGEYDESTEAELHYSVNQYAYNIAESAKKTEAEKSFVKALYLYGVSADAYVAAAANAAAN